MIAAWKYLASCSHPRRSASRLAGCQPKAVRPTFFEPFNHFMFTDFHCYPFPVALPRSCQPRYHSFEEQFPVGFLGSRHRERAVHRSPSSSLQIYREVSFPSPRHTFRRFPWEEGSPSVNLASLVGSLYLRFCELPMWTRTYRLFCGSTPARSLALTHPRRKHNFRTNENRPGAMPV